MMIVITLRHPLWRHMSFSRCPPIDLKWTRFIWERAPVNTPVDKGEKRRRMRQVIPSRRLDAASRITRGKKRPRILRPSWSCISIGTRGRLDDEGNKGLVCYSRCAPAWGAKRPSYQHFSYVDGNKKILSTGDFFLKIRGGHVLDISIPIENKIIILFSLSNGLFFYFYMFLF